MLFVIGGIGYVSISTFACEGSFSEKKQQVTDFYRVRLSSSATHPKLSVFWVYASNTARYEQAYRDLAEELKLPGRTESGIEVFKLVSRWLSDAANGSWLVILDNADDKNMFIQDVELGVNQGQPIASPRATLIHLGIEQPSGAFSRTIRISYIGVMEWKDVLNLLQTRVT